MKPITREECREMLQTYDALKRAEQVTSELAPTETAGPAKVVAAVATGSPAVPSANDYAALSRCHRELYADLAERDKRLNATRQRLDALLLAANDFIANVVNHHVAGWGDCQVQFDASFKELRRQAEYATERQPQENGSHEPRP